RCPPPAFASACTWCSILFLPPSVLMSTSLLNSRRGPSRRCSSHSSCRSASVQAAVGFWSIATRSKSTDVYNLLSPRAAESTSRSDQRSSQVALRQGASPVGPRRWNALRHNLGRGHNPITLGCRQSPSPRRLQSISLEQWCSLFDASAQLKVSRRNDM